MQQVILSVVDNKVARKKAPGTAGGPSMEQQSGKRALLVEDDRQLSEHILSYLQEINLQVTHCAEGNTALQVALNNEFDIILLDLMLPGMSGLDICHAIRKHNPIVPIIIITALDTEAERILGLDQGADDYLVKPFSIRELQARVRAHLRRSDHLKAASEGQGKSREYELVRGEFSLNATRRELKVRDKKIELTAKEFDLMQYFMENQDLVLSRNQLLDAVWGYGYNGYQHTVNSHINRLRQKIESKPDHPEHVVTVWGVGYKFSASAVEA